jgi:ribosomal-protein-alanine N-acetyltransferase
MRAGSGGYLAHVDSPRMRVLHTSRLELQPCRAEDLDSLYDLWRLPLVRQFLWDDVAIDRQQAGDVLRDFLDAAATRDLGLWIVRTGVDTELLGFWALREIPPGLDVELLYGLAPQVWGQGLATEGARAVLEYAFDVLKLRRVWARTDRPNVASQRVIERLGMRPGDNPELEPTALMAYVIDRATFLAEDSRG